MPEVDQEQDGDAREAVAFYVQGAEKVFPESTTFHYIKSPQFRTIHADGAIGGITPRKYIHCALYSERAAIPRVTEAEIADGIATGRNRVVETRLGYVREIDIDIMLDLEAAKALAKWLSDRVAELEAQLNDAT